MTIIPPPHERDTEPPENSRDSSAPPADLGPTGLALRLLALEEQVSDVHLETKGARQTLEDIVASLRKISGQLDVLRGDAQGQRRDRANTRTDLDELTRRVVALEERRNRHEVGNGKPDAG